MAFGAFGFWWASQEIARPCNCLRTQLAACREDLHLRQRLISSFEERNDASAHVSGRFSARLRPRAHTVPGPCSRDRQLARPACMRNFRRWANSAALSFCRLCSTALHNIHFRHTPYGCWHRGSCASGPCSASCWRTSRSSIGSA